MERHGGNIHQYHKKIIDFSANIHPDGVPPQILQAMQNALEETVHYPDPEYQKLKIAIAKKHKILKEQIICGNGAADLIFRLALVLKAKKILLPVPTFVEYEEAFRMPVLPEPQIIYDKMDKEKFEIQENLLDRMDDSVDLLILCNPNNPTGKKIENHLLKQIVKKAGEHHIFLLLDECFLDFSIEGNRESMIPYLAQYPNLFILKSFTKMYGIPGTRLGYGLCSDTNLLKRLEAVSQSWAVSHIAQKAGIAACAMAGYEEVTAKKVAALRNDLLLQMKKLPIKIWESSVNYLFFQVRGHADLKEQCLKYGICIRHCNNYRGLGEDYYRVAVRKKEENDKLAEVLKHVLEKEIRP